MIYELVNPADLSDSFLKEDLVLLDFYANWCEPCKWLDIILMELSENCDFPVTILKIDTEIFKNLVLEYNIQSVPVLIILKNRSIKWRMNGFLYVQELKNILKNISRETENNGSV